MPLKRIPLIALILGLAIADLATAQTTVTFQQGVNGYTSTFDRRISVGTNVNGADVDTNFSSFFIDGDPDDDSRADYLIRFDDILGGPGIPTGATILDAQLTFRTTSSSVSGNSQSGESYNIYRLAQPFDGASTLDGDFGDGNGSFTSFVDGVEVSQGEADINTGTFDEPTSGGGLAVDSFYSADVTRAVQSWVNGDPNLGLAVKSDHVDNDDGWSVHSTGSSDPSFRPELSVTYSTDPNLEVFELQEGLNGYNGTTDIRTSSFGPTDNGANVSETFLDGSDAASANVNGADVDTTSSSFFIDGDPNDASRADYLIRFDNILGGSGIPDGATIFNAELTLQTTSSAVSGNSQSGESYNVYRLAQPFDGTSSLDGDFGDGNGSFTPFVDGVEASQGEADINTGTFDEPVSGGGLAVDTAYSANVTRAVQSWVNGDPNLGLAVKSDHVDNDDGWSVHSTGSSDISARPELSVTYSTDAGIELFELQDGLNGYNGTTDIIISQSGATVNGANVDQAFLDGANTSGSPDAPYLIQFDLAGVTDPVQQAELILKTGIASGSSDSGGPYTVHQLLVPFTTSSTYSDFAGDVNAMLNAGQIGPEIARFESIDEAELVSADISTAVTNWLGGDPNHGLYIGANGTSNGWQIFTSGATDPDLAPMLRILTAQDTPTLETMTFQEGVDGYNGTFDRRISSATSPDAPYLIQFDLSTLPDLSALEVAELILKTGISSGASDSGGPYTVHQLLVPFTESSLYTDFAGDVDAMLAAGQIGPEVARFISIDEAELVKVDISTILENWLMNGDPNYGIYIGANGTSNGWQIFTSGASDPDLAPLLRIVANTGTTTTRPIPEPAGAVLWSVLGLGLVIRRKRSA